MRLTMANRFFRCVTSIRAAMRGGLGTVSEIAPVAQQVDIARAEDVDFGRFAVAASRKLTRSKPTGRSPVSAGTEPNFR